jgi:hypothetical protein
MDCADVDSTEYASLTAPSVVDASRATCIIDDDDLFDMWVSIEVERQAR